MNELPKELIIEIFEKIDLKKTFYFIELSKTNKKFYFIYKQYFEENVKRNFLSYGFMSLTGNPQTTFFNVVYKRHIIYTNTDTNTTNTNFFINVNPNKHKIEIIKENN